MSAPVQAQLLLRRREFTGARELLERGLSHIRDARATDPGNGPWRTFEHNLTWNLARALIGVRDHAQAAEVAARLPEIDPSSRSTREITSGLLERCAGIATEDATLDPAAREALAARYRARAGKY